MRNMNAMALTSDEPKLPVNIQVLSIQLVLVILCVSCVYSWVCWSLLVACCLLFVVQEHLREVRDLTEALTKDESALVKHDLANEPERSVRQSRVMREREREEPPQKSK